MRESENIKKALTELVSKIDFGPADYEIFETKPGVIQLYVVDTPEDYPYKDIPREEEGIWDFAININKAPEIGKYVLTEYSASENYEKDPKDFYLSYFDFLDEAIEAVEEIINGYLPRIHKKANAGYKAYKKYLGLEEDKKQEGNKMLLDENLFEDVIQRRSRKNLKESWSNKIPEKLAKAFRNALEQSDDEPMGAVIEPTKDVIEWLLENYPEEEDEFEEMLSDLDTLDAGGYPDDPYSEDWDDDEDENTNEAFFNNILDRLYDECDYLRVWIPTDVDF